MRAALPRSAPATLQELALLAGHFKRSDLPATRAPLRRYSTYRLLLKALAAITRNRTYGLRPAASAAKRPCQGSSMAQILAGGRAGWRERSGLDALGGGLTVQEACVVFLRLLRDLNGPSESLACLALTTVFVRRYPRDLAQFALSDQAGAGVCLTQDLAQFRFDASGLRVVPGQAPVARGFSRHPGSVVTRCRSNTSWPSSGCVPSGGSDRPPPVPTTSMPPTTSAIENSYSFDRALLPTAHHRAARRLASAPPYLPTATTRCWLSVSRTWIHTR